MLQQLRIAFFLLLALTVLTGGVYPLLVTAIAQVMFPAQAKGSLIVKDDKSVGSEFIGQSFTQPKYFWGRLSATGTMPYNAAASSGSNYGPLHPDLKLAVEKRIAALVTSDSPATGIPVDLVTASASGLDPHISPAAAEFQVSRIAKSRTMNEVAVRELIRQHTAGRQFGILGEPGVNVLRLNMALDEQNRE